MRKALSLICLLLLVANPSALAQAKDPQKLDKELGEIKTALEALKEDVADIKAGMAMIMEIFERSSNKRQPVAEVSFQSDRSIENDFALGQTEAPVTILAYLDYQCGFCARFYGSVLPELLKKYVDSGKARFVFRDFIISSHPQAALAASIASCAGKQDKYLAAIEALFGKAELLAAAKLDELFAQIKGLDIGQLKECLQSADFAPVPGSAGFLPSRKARLDMDEGQKIGVMSTPSFFVGRTQAPGSRMSGYFIRGARELETFSEVIDGILQKGK